MLDDGTIERSESDYLYDEAVGNSITEEMERTYFDGEFHAVNCDMHQESFSIGWTFYDRWVAEWRADETSPALQTPIVPNLDEDLLAAIFGGDAVELKRVRKKPTKPPVQETSTRTLTLESVESSGMMCSLCFYKGHQCLTSECKRRYWKLIDTVDKP